MKGYAENMYATKCNDGTGVERMENTRRRSVNTGNFDTALCYEIGGYPLRKRNNEVKLQAKLQARERRVGIKNISEAAGS